MITFFNRNKNSKVHRKDEPTLINRMQNYPSLEGFDYEPIESKTSGDIGRLVQSNYGGWRVKFSEDTALIPMGCYDFVTLINGDIHVIASASDTVTHHAYLSGYAPAILYAGKIQFDVDFASEMVSWNNRSDEYLTSANLHKQAGLSSELFIEDELMNRLSTKVGISRKIRRVLNNTVFSDNKEGCCSCLGRSI